MVGASVRHAEHRDHRGHQLHEHKLEGIGYCQRDEHHSEDLRGKRQTQVEERSDHDGQQTDRHHVNQFWGKLHQNIRRNDDQQHECQQQDNVLQLSKDLIMQLVAIQAHDDENQRHKENLAQ